MKIKSEDAVELAMDWLAQLHDDGRAGPHAVAADLPGVAADLPGVAADLPGVAADPSGVNSSGGVETSAATEITERAPIGDELRIPIAWCEMGSCISYYTDPVALGEADIRSRAIAAGWRVDALSRLACPKCQQSVSWFWTASPVVQWDRDRAVATASLMAAAVYEDATCGDLADPDPGEIPVVRPASSPCPARGRHRTRRRRPGRTAEQAAAQGGGRPLHVRGDGPA